MTSVCAGDAGDFDPAIQQQHIYFGAQAKSFLWQIDARLDARAGIDEQRTRVVRLVVIKMRAVAMHLRPDVVAGAMHEGVAVARF